MILHLTCMFGCAWKIKFSRKAFQLTVCFMALTRKLVYTFIFITNYFRVSDAQREREREKRELPIHPKPIAPQHRRRHISRTTTEIASPSKTDPPKIDLIGVVVTHDRSRHPLDLVSISSLPITNLVSISLPMIHDRSLPFPPFLITLSSSLSQFD